MTDLDRLCVCQFKITLLHLSDPSLNVTRTPTTQEFLNSSWGYHEFSLRKVCAVALVMSL